MFYKPSTLLKKPRCPDGFSWQDERHKIVELISEWVDFRHRGRIAKNITSAHASVASLRGSWGVGQYYFRVRTTNNRIFDLYYDRAPKDADDRKGKWFLFRGLIEESESNSTSNNY